MSAIVHNGNLYNRIGGDAKDVKYDNTNTDIDATNIQEAIDYLSENASSGIQFNSKEEYDEWVESEDYDPSVDAYYPLSGEGGFITAETIMRADGVTSVEQSLSDIDTNLDTLNTNLGKLIDPIRWYTGDLNDINENSIYSAQSSCSNVPENEHGYLVTYKSQSPNDYVCQTWHGYDNGNIFTRVKKAGTWGVWERLVTNSDLNNIPIEANRTITFSNDYTEITVYRCGYNNIRAHIEIDVKCNIVSNDGWISDFGMVLPEGYRPSENVIIPAWCESDNEKHMSINLILGANGKVSGFLGASHSSIKRICIMATYFK